MTRRPPVTRSGSLGAGMAAIDPAGGVAEELRRVRKIHATRADLRRKLADRRSATTTKEQS